VSKFIILFFNVLITKADYRIFFEYKVQWGQMDAARHVNNLEYLRWAESARVEYFEKMNINISFGVSTPAPILAWQECKYIYPMTYPDTAVVGIKIGKLLKDRFELETSIFSKKYDRIACVSKQSIVAYDYLKLNKVDMPEHWIERIKHFELW
jgi:acyl-CoA thioester hydrolase